MSIINQTKATILKTMTDFEIKINNNPGILLKGIYELLEITLFINLMMFVNSILCKIWYESLSSTFIGEVT